MDTEMQGERQTDTYLAALLVHTVSSMVLIEMVDAGVQPVHETSPAFLISSSSLRMPGLM